MSTFSILSNLKLKIQYLRDDVEKYRNLYEEKCCEIEAEKFKKEEAENKVAFLTKTLSLNEAEKEQLESRYQQINQKLNEVLMNVDEYQRAQRVNLCRQAMDDEKIANLEDQVRMLRKAADETGIKYEEVARKLVMMETQYEKVEERREIAEEKAFQLDNQLQGVTIHMKLLQTSESSLASKEREYMNTISVLTEKLKESQDSTENMSRELRSRDLELQRTEKYLQDVQENYALLKEELDSCYRDLENI